jgi:Fe-S-cluster containining protein
MEQDLATEVNAAACRPEVRAAVHDLYDRLAIQVDSRKPICVLSGRCCRFEEYGHRLYVTTIELAAFISQWRADASNPLRVVQGACPFQTGKLCGVHAIRPFGCRIFYCDPTATEWQQAQYEQFHAELKRLHETLGIQYHYVEWRSALAILELAPVPLP